MQMYENLKTQIFVRSPVCLRLRDAQLKTGSSARTGIQTADL